MAQDKQPERGGLEDVLRRLKETNAYSSLRAVGQVKDVNHNQIGPPTPTAAPKAEDQNQRERLLKTNEIEPRSQAQGAGQTQQQAPSQAPRQQGRSR